MVKVIQEIICSHCGNKIHNETELDLIFDGIIKKIPATKGPIDSIKVLLKNEKPKLKAW